LAKRKTTRSDRPGRREQIAWLAAIVVVAALIYIPSLHGGFLLDDRELIILNPASQGLSDLPKAFTTYFLFGFDKTDLLYYRPLITVSYELNNALSLHDPFACRLTNLLLNCLMGALVFVFAKSLAGNTALAGSAGLAFVVLPSHSETVSWIAGRTDIIAGIFMLAGFLAFLANYRKRPRFDWRLAALASLMFGCGLFAKENALLLPVLAGVYVLTVGDSMKREEVVKWLPAVVVPVVAYWACRRVALGGTLDAQMGYLLGERLSRVGFVYAKYLRMLFLPQDTRPVYDGLRTEVIAPVVKAVAWLVPAGLVAISIWARKRLPILAFGAGWVFVTLLPVADIVPVRGLVIAERFVYLPTIGSALALGWLYCRLRRLRPDKVRTLPIAVGLVGAAYVMYCGALSITGSQYYQSNLAWAKWVAAHQPKLKLIRMTASSFLEEAGYEHEAAQELEAAVDLGWRGVSNAHKAQWKRKLAMTYVRLGDYTRAARSLGDAVRFSPRSGEAWRDLARVYLALKRYPESIGAYERADRLHALGPADYRDLAEARKQAAAIR
jgi:hypothetical protein